MRQSQSAMPIDTSQPVQSHRERVLRDRGATQAITRAFGLRKGVVAGKISCSPHPLRSTRLSSAEWRNSYRLYAVNSSSRRRSFAFRSVTNRAQDAIASAVRTPFFGAPCGASLGDKVERAAIHPHPMHDHGELARRRHDGALVAACLGDFDAPGPSRRTIFSSAPV